MSTSVVDSGGFFGGAPIRVEGWLGLIRRDNLKVGLRAVLVVLFGWVPLVVLSAISDVINGGSSLSILLRDVGSYARYIVAAPLFIIAEATCFPKYQRIIAHLCDSGIIPERDQGRYERLVHSSSKMLRSGTIEAALFGLAYALTAYLHATRSQAAAIAWSYTSPPELSLAGTWHLFVTIPLFLVLLFGWVWRHIVWAQFLWSVSRMDLQLVGTHPDLCGGLRFLSTTMRGYRPLAVACAATVAGGIANNAIHAGVPVMAYRDPMIAVILVVVTIIAAPLLVFVPVMKRLRAAATFNYGRLAAKFGRQVEEKWVSRREENRPEDLTVEDFSTTNDLYTMVGNVFKTKIVPVSVESLRDLMIVTAMPFLVVLLASFPVKTIFDALIKLVIG
jgi:hypothetical protein